jgi:hypothetical protein
MAKQEMPSNASRPILVSSLREELDLISISLAAQVVRESMQSPAARHMGVPTVPLTDLYNRAGDYIRARGGVLHFRRPVENFSADSSQVRLQLRDQNPTQLEGAPPISLRPLQGQGGDFDYLVLALPFDALDSSRKLPRPRSRNSPTSRTRLSPGSCGWTARSLTSIRAATRSHQTMMPTNPASNPCTQDANSALTGRNIELRRQFSKSSSTDRKPKCRPRSRRSREFSSRATLIW